MQANLNIFMFFEGRRNNGKRGVMEIFLNSSFFKTRVTSLANGSGQQVYIHKSPINI
jgi:hypothetical protein